MSENMLVIGKIKEGHTEQVRAIIDEGPPFSLWDSTLERHLIFLGDNRVAFFFEGRAGLFDAIKQVAKDPGVLQQMMRIGEHLDGAPGQPSLVFEWNREDEAKKRMDESDRWESFAG